MSIVERAAATIRRHRMLAGGETVLVAVSGGADSVALLHVLVALAPSLRLTLHVGHVDHQLRPGSSDDAAFVGDIATKLGVGVDVVLVDVPRSGSPEEAARRARYGALDAIATRIGATRLAVGHTAEDQAETVVIRLLQGAGPRGLAGIPPVRGRIIRPLIGTRRQEVLDRLRRDGIAWREDPSNEDRRFLRNRVRHDLMPQLAHVNPAIVEALGRTARLMRETIEAAERVALAELEAASAESGAIVLSLDRLRALPHTVAAEVLRQAAARLGSAAPLRAWAHRGLDRVLAAPPPPGGVRVGGVRVDVSGGRVRVARAARRGVRRRLLAVPGVTEIPEVGLAMHARVIDADGYTVPRTARAVAFDADGLRGPLVVRARARGDRFTPFAGRQRKLKDVLIDAKVPRWDRDAIPLVEVDGGIAWIAGVRRGDAAPVTGATRRVLELGLTALADGPADR
ncbi:MAG: tRNA lysidine(34) synthetase TilS [Candidatus Rokubacteria bacterium]|nr:tRNA lysidine(34) synthetase TilS [Candidatus Rokubacteria bacterium]